MQMTQNKMYEIENENENENENKQDELRGLAADDSW